jgi:hypothetical protein
MDFNLTAWYVSPQAFLDSAGDEGVLYVAMGTLATLGVAIARPTVPWSDFFRVSQMSQPWHYTPFTIGCGGTLRPLGYCTGLKERQAMAASFAALPVRVLWRLAPSEVPDDAALAELGAGNNTKVMSALLALQMAHLFSGPPLLV